VNLRSHARGRSTLRAALMVVLAGLAASLVPAARADGDPASDYLLAQQVFLPIDVKLPAKQEAELKAFVNGANKAGFKVRVALIASRYDMGSVTSLYRKPRTYARFLGAELAFVYKQRLLVVMPNGFGFNWPKHPRAHEYATLASVPIRPGNAGLVVAARLAVQRLTAAAGVKVAAPAAVTAHHRGTSSGRVTIIAATAAALLAAVALAFVLRRRRR
jgi:hypothetical protein